MRADAIAHACRRVPGMVLRGGAQVFGEVLEGLRGLREMLSGGQGVLLYERKKIGWFHATRVEPADWREQMKGD